jgi:hypothetical protein
LHFPSSHPPPPALPSSPPPSPPWQRRGARGEQWRPWLLARQGRCVVPCHCAGSQCGRGGANSVARRGLSASMAAAAAPPSSDNWEHDGGTTIRAPAAALLGVLTTARKG